MCTIGFCNNATVFCADPKNKPHSLYSQFQLVLFIYLTFHFQFYSIIHIMLLAFIPLSKRILFLCVCVSVSLYNYFVIH